MKTLGPTAHGAPRHPIATDKASHSARPHSAERTPPKTPLYRPITSMGTTVQADHDRPRAQVSRSPAQSRQRSDLTQP